MTGYKPGLKISAALCRSLWLTVVITACAGSGAGAGAPPAPSVDYDRSYDFSAVRKLAIQPINRTLISTMDITDERQRLIDAAIVAELQRRGLQVVDDNAEADLLLSWSLVIEGETDHSVYDSAGRYNCWSCSSPVEAAVAKYPEGTFIIDMIDPIQLRSVWRSKVHSRMRGDADSAQAAEFRSEAAEAVFAQFPPN